MKFDLVDYFNILKSPRSVVFVGRSQDDNSKHFFMMSDMYPYFGVPHDEKHIHDGHRSVIKMETTHDITGKKITKIYVRRADDVTNLRDDYTMTYESNVLFHDRVKIDLGIKSGFEVPDDRIHLKCFGCGGYKYHEIHSTYITSKW